MNAFLRFLNRNRAARPNRSRFDRYYSGVLRSGSGYPTADEARKDLRTYDRSTSTFGWPR